MIKIKPVLVNVVMYSLMLGGMALSCFDAIERGVHAVVPRLNSKEAHNITARNNAIGLLKFFVFI